MIKILQELEELEQEELDKQLLDAGTLPEAPQTELKEAIAATSKLINDNLLIFIFSLIFFYSPTGSKSKDAEEDELEALKQWAT